MEPMGRLMDACQVVLGTTRSDCREACARRLYKVFSDFIRLWCSEHDASSIHCSAFYDVNMTMHLG